MKQMGAVNSELEELFQDKKRARNPLVPIGKSLNLALLNLHCVLILYAFLVISHFDLALSLIEIVKL